jgi:hypothetical protein
MVAAAVVVVVDIVMAMIGSANDKSDSVRESVFTGLLDISHRQPELTLSSCLQFVKNGV